jgi:prepilin-type N-terminal cleavage/methylation domain-containing protein
MKSLRLRPTLQGKRAGFSLIELLAVMVILSILMTFLAFKLGGMGESAKAEMTNTFIENIGLAASEFESETGDYPPSSWNNDWGALPNKQNLGGEVLCVSLWSEEYGGVALSEDSLDNTDGDRSKKSLTTHANRDLFELVDSWGNPIAYFHRRDYGREDIYTTIDNETGEWAESTVKALMSPKTGNYQNPRQFQLISAGKDGIFGTEDDLCNFATD